MALNQVVGVKTEAPPGSFSSDSVIVTSGSGFIISGDGYILTNHHVIESAYEFGYTLRVFLHDGTTYDAKIVGFEKDNDVAVIKIDAEGLNAVTTGDSDALRVGDQIYAVGDPLGELEYTMTDGMISALDRTIAVDSKTSISMFQISAAVNSGNSGGPVYDSKGEVIGIVSAKYKDVGIEGLGFAIPVNDAVDIAEQLISVGYVTGKAYMGISVMTINSSAASYYNLTEGAYVVTVEPGSCADTAGLKAGDIITALDDTRIQSQDALTTAKKKYKAHDTAELTVYRAGETLTLAITFDEDTRTTADGGLPETQPVPNPQPRQQFGDEWQELPLVPFPNP
jgi:serine protease Do